MKRNLGKKFQSTLLTENMTTLQRIAQPARVFQIARRSSRQSFPAPNAAIISTISVVATHEMIRLNASCSASVV